jgi:hypothetical protein
MGVPQGPASVAHQSATDAAREILTALGNHLAHRATMRDLAGFFLAHRESWRMASWGALNDHGPGFIEYLARGAK